MVKELSVFIDESGDFGNYDPKCPYYIISAVFHNQADDLSLLFYNFDYALMETASQRNFVHIGPLIRREYEYTRLSVEERLRIYRRTQTFVKRAKFVHKSFIVEKKHVKTATELAAKLTGQISNFIQGNYRYFAQFDRIKVYYDNGQDGVAKIIRTVFSGMFNNFEIKNVRQEDYRMLQVADFVCAAALMKLKMKCGATSRSERRILGDDKMIEKMMLKMLRKKEFDELK